MMRVVLNVIVDILTLLAIALAGVGHMMPWFEPVDRHNAVPPGIRRDAGDELPKAQAEAQKAREAKLKEERMQIMDFQAWHAIRSGASLGVLALLVCLSLIVPWGPVAQRILVLLMFLCAVTSVVFICLGFTPYSVTEMHQEMFGKVREDWGFFLALIPSCIAAGLCLIRMVWTMPSFKKWSPARTD